MKQLFALLVAIWATTAVAQTGPESKSKTPIHQLRIYEVPVKNRQAFNDRFRDHAHRIMKKYGFKIVAMWESTADEKLEFVYLLEWEDEATMKNAWTNFMADQEWKEIKARTTKIHGDFVNEIEDRTLVLTGYSPRKTLLE